MGEYAALRKQLIVFDCVDLHIIKQFVGCADRELHQANQDYKKLQAKCDAMSKAIEKAETYCKFNHAWQTSGTKFYEKMGAYTKLVESLNDLIDLNNEEN